MGWCTAQSKMLLLFMKTTMKESRYFEKEKYYGHPGLYVSVFLQGFFTPLGMLFVVKTLKDDWYIVIKA